jgi:hypothetical protein
LKRSFISILVLVALFVVLLLAYGNSLLAEGDVTDEANATALILSGQKPKRQEIISGEDVNFTVSITNTGAIPLDSVSITNATASSCNRDNLGSLGPGQSLSYLCEQENIPESTLFELKANGTAGASTAGHTSNAFVKVLKSELSVIKLPLTQTVQAGDTAQFQVIITNNSGAPLVNLKVDDNVANDCDVAIVFFLDDGQKLDYDCSLDDVQSPQVSILTVQATNLADGTTVSVSEAAWIEVLKLQASLTPQPASVPEPGNLVAYTVNLVNSGSKDLALVGLTTAQYGNLLDPNNPLVTPVQNTCLQSTPPTLPPHGGSYSCSFVAEVSGQPGNFNVNLTATGKDKNDKVETATASASVVISNLPASLNLSLGADPPFITPPSRPVTFKIQVENTSEADLLTITELTDQFFGNLDGKGNCDLPFSGLLPGESYQCEFVAPVSGQVGEKKSRTISVKAVDDDPNPSTLIASKVITVDIIAMPPQAIFFPNVTEDTVEPNVKCADAYPLLLNKSYYFKPPAVYPGDQDYFKFELTQNSRVRVELTNFKPQAGQILVRSGDACISIEGKNATTALNKTVDLGLKPAGTYYIQIINDNKDQVFTEMYSLIVRLY